MSNYPVNPDMIKYSREDTTDTTVTLTPKKPEGPVRIEIPSSHSDRRETVFHGPSSEIRNLPGHSFLEGAVRDREQTGRSAVFKLSHDIYGNRRPDGFFDVFRYFRQVMTNQALWNTDNWKDLSSQELDHIHNPHVEAYRADPISSLSITFRAASIIFILFSIIWVINPTDIIHLIPLVLEKMEYDYVSVYYRLYFNNFIEHATLYEGEGVGISIFDIPSLRVSSMLSGQSLFHTIPQTIVDSMQGLLQETHTGIYRFTSTYFPQIFTASVHPFYAYLAELDTYSLYSVFRQLVYIQDDDADPTRYQRWALVFDFVNMDSPSYLHHHMVERPRFLGTPVYLNADTMCDDMYAHQIHLNEFCERRVAEEFAAAETDAERLAWFYSAAYDLFISFSIYQPEQTGYLSTVPHYIFSVLPQFFLFTSYYWLMFYTALTVHAVHGVSHTFMDQAIGTDEIRTRAPLWVFLERFLVLVIVGIL